MCIGITDRLRCIHMHVNEPTHHAFTNNWAEQSQCNSVSRHMDMYIFQLEVWIYSLTFVHGLSVAGARSQTQMYAA